MNQTDPRSQAAFDAATNHIRTTAAAVADRVATHLGVLASAAQRVFERDLLINAQLDLRRNMSSYMLAFGDMLSARVTQEINPHHDASRKPAETDWQTLSLVNDDEVEERMFADRISQAIAHSCEWELRDLASFTGAMLGMGRADHDRNPLRPEVLGAAVYRGISSITNDVESRKLLSRELGAALSKVMPECYRDIVTDFRARGIVPVKLSMRGVEGPGHASSGYDRQDTGSSTRSGGFDGTTAASEFDGALPHHTGPGGHPTGSGRTTSGAWGSSRPGRAPGQTAAGAFTPRPGVSPQADAELMTLIRRLTFLASRPADLNDTGSGGADGITSSGAGIEAGGTMPFSAGTPGQPAMMAVNMIRAHRDELRQASTGTLDHMVIDVVGSLFDQILSDPRVPPQMARQIARLQLPVLRVALSDQTFFSSRKHPVRRFVNRIASLALAFETFDSGPAHQFLARVRELVQEIVDGDFDQMEVYTAKLEALESFIAQQAREGTSGSSDAVAVVNDKEADLRVQQRYMQQLHAALSPLSLQDYLRDFLAQVWSQALAVSTRKEGAQSEVVQRLRRVGRDLVMSVQPKGSPALRKKFLTQLPLLMKDLNEGLRLIGWPEAAQKEFFGRLLPAHAESLKGQPMTELEYNLLAKQLEAVFNTPVPESETLLRDAPMPPTGTPAIEPKFTPEEAQRIGLVEESAVNWSGEIDIDLSAGPEPEPVSAYPDTAPADLDIDLSALGVDINLDATPDPTEPPTHGPHLIDHVRLGFAYQMNLNSEWQKVRLSYVSPGRAFFVFTRGKRHTETVSLTSRMLARMCETGRFRAFESAYLMERATARARKQLAELSRGKSGHKGSSDRASLGKR